MYNEMNVVLMPANTISILQPIDQKVISTFKSYYLRNTSHNAITAVDSGSGQSLLKIFQKGLVILNTIKNACDSLEKVEILTLTGVWKKLTPTLMEDFEGIKTSGEEVTADVVEIAKELELEVAPEDVTELLQSKDKILIFFLWMSKVIS